MIFLLTVKSFWPFLVVFSATLHVDAAPPSHSQHGRRIELHNQSGKNLVVEWVNPKTGRVVTLQPTFAPGAKSVFNSFVNHTFAVHEADGVCGGHEEEPHEHDPVDCQVQFITIQDEDLEDDDKKNTIAQINIKRNLEVSYDANDASADQEFAADCKEQALKDISSGFDREEVLNELADCLEEEATQLFQDANDEIAFEQQIRLNLSADIENITCTDPNKETSIPVDVRSWDYRNLTRVVNVMHDRPSSQIHVLEDFITKEECDAITAAAKPKLHRGTVADGSGGHKLSDHRKAWQAGVSVPWHKEQDDDPIARVVRRIYEYTNHAVGYNLTIDGQEDLMSIQYFGNGQNSTELPDQYRPHCDGNCDDLPHKAGGRVATMVMYCDVPDLGGATNFQNANVFVKPKLHAAAFFSYLDPISHKMEPGFTSHSGCPVVEGTKRIAVHWMRVGVDKENPWSSFNTLTIKKGEEEDC